MLCESMLDSSPSELMRLIHSVKTQQSDVSPSVVYQIGCRACNSIHTQSLADPANAELPRVLELWTFQRELIMRTARA